MRIHLTVWADCVRESEITGFVGQWNQSLSWTISRTESLITAIFWLLNIYLTGRTQDKRILTNKMTFRTIYCYSLSFYAQTTCLENRNRKKCSSEILWNKKGNHEKHLCLIKKRKNSRRNAFGQRTKLNLFHTTAFKFWKAFRKVTELPRFVSLSLFVSKLMNKTVDPVLLN